MPDVEPVVVPMTEADLPAVLEIQAASFPIPWSAASFRREFDLAWANVEVLKHPGDGVVLATTSYWIVGDEVHLLSIATRLDRRRQGYGARLLRHVLARGEEAGCRRISLEVRPSNREARALYRRFGFAQIAIRPRYYQDNGEAALVLERPLEPVYRSDRRLAG